MAIDVVFAGLMLICLEGQSECAGKYGKNTAWIVRADGASRPCGWNSSEVTQFTLHLPSNISLDDPQNRCTKGEKSTTCHLPEGDICLSPVSPAGEPHQRLDSSLSLLPRINEVDRRFKNLQNLDRSDYVPVRIHFAGGMITSGPKWHEDQAIQWYKSKGAHNEFPRELADRLKVSYKPADGLRLIDCVNKSVILNLPPQPGDFEIVFQNYAKTSPVPDYTDGRYDNLAYLLWYYRLGSWNDTDGGKCPTYTDAKKDAILLRCEPKDCSYFSRGNSRYWPLMLGPDKRTGAPQGAQ